MPGGGTTQNFGGYGMPALNAPQPNAPASGPQPADPFGARAGADLAANPTVLAFDAERIDEVAAGLASLDVAIPQRGRMYRFTTPRGDLEITARSIPMTVLSRFYGLIAISLAVCAVRADDAAGPARVDAAREFCRRRPCARGAGTAQHRAGHLPSRGSLDSRGRHHHCDPLANDAHAPAGLHRLTFTHLTQRHGDAESQRGRRQVISSLKLNDFSAPPCLCDSVSKRVNEAAAIRHRR